MANGDDKLIGEIHEMCRQAKTERAELFGLVREVREGGCTVGTANAKAIYDLKRFCFFL